MKFLFSLLSSGLWISITQAVSMIDYNPDCGVDPEFGPWYSELLAEVENPTSSCSFTNFFAPNGSMIILGDIAQGANAILRSKHALLPANGSIQWNHFPNRTTVSSEMPTEKSFQLSGVMQAISTADGNCSTTYFQTRFTVTKNSATGMPNLTPHSSSLLIYDGFVITPSEAPCTKL
ncbi:hypothetical protein BGZ60DRAFT_533521 [Tricladium varicosporioides]|nr:hypothetical protein BGZ60DRAFT_533521 [Hymenoscyphus varicosporioides]